LKTPLNAGVCGFWSERQTNFSQFNVNAPNFHINDFTSKQTTIVGFSSSAISKELKEIPFLPIESREIDLNFFSGN
jgi:hypothetical protein